MTLIRAFAAGLVALSAYFVVTPFAAAAMPDSLPVFAVQVSAALFGMLAGLVVWRMTGEDKDGLLSSVGRGALVVGGASFLLGFVGPIIFMPDANQGPMLGIFVTGPFGAVLGAAGGLVWWFVRGRRAEN